MLVPITMALVVSTSAPQLMAPPLDGLKASELHDSFDQMRGASRHEAIDILAARGTPVNAVVDGVIAKLFLSKAGGKTIYLFDPPGAFCYYYAHLDAYQPELREGMHVSHGQVIGYVGSTGDASPSAPHLHFTIFRLGPEKHWWEGTAVNPYPILLRFFHSSD